MTLLRRDWIKVNPDPPSFLPSPFLAASFPLPLPLSLLPRPLIIHPLIKKMEN